MLYLWENLLFARIKLKLSNYIMSFLTIIEFIERLFSFTGQFLGLSEPSSATGFWVTLDDAIFAFLGFSEIRLSKHVSASLTVHLQLYNSENLSFALGFSIIDDVSFVTVESALLLFTLFVTRIVQVSVTDEISLNDNLCALKSSEQRVIVLDLQKIRPIFFQH